LRATNAFCTLFQIFDESGSFLSYINVEREPLYGPQGVTSTHQGYVAVADSGNQCIKVYRILQWLCNGSPLDRDRGLESNLKGNLKKVEVNQITQNTFWNDNGIFTSGLLAVANFSDIKCDQPKPSKFCEAFRWKWNSRTLQARKFFVLQRSWVGLSRNWKAAPINLLNIHLIVHGLFPCRFNHAHFPDEA